MRRVYWITTRTGSQRRVSTPSSLQGWLAAIGAAGIAIGLASIALFFVVSVVVAAAALALVGAGASYLLNWKQSGGRGPTLGESERTAKHAKRDDVIDV